MKYATILTALISSLLSSVSARDGPYVCTGNNVENFEIGGFNIPVDDYAGPRAYINKVWLAHDDVTITAYSDFDPVALTGDLGELTAQKNNVQGSYRGIGVEGGDKEISDDEGVYITFGGRKVKELRFGIRALFGEEENNTQAFESGLVTIYESESNAILDQIGFTTDGDDGDDGQEFYTITSNTAFDAISFITFSHRLYANANDDINHDYFLEYLELCVPTENGVITGDPHIRTWSGNMYDFHGVCDLVLLQNPDFEDGLGMNIHVRTSQLKQFSYVSSAALQIGNDILEVMGESDVYWINREAHKNPEKGIVGSISGYPITYEQVNEQQYKFSVDLGDDMAISIMTFKKIVRVDIDGATEEKFGKSGGLLGAYGSGNMMSRDRSTIIEDANAFGQEWQVLPFEEMLFHDVEGPQAPEKCFLPLASNLRRRLGEGFSEEEATVACARVDKEEFALCVFDVMATGDKAVARSYYKDFW